MSVCPSFTPMKRLYDLITKANQILLFVAALALVGLAAYWVIDLLPGDRWEGPQVPIAQTPEERRKIKIDDIRFLGKFDGYHMFGVIKGMIDARYQSDGDISSAASKISGAGGGSAEMVNVLFVVEGKSQRALLASDGLVLWHNLASKRLNDEFRFHRFHCITEDTNGDRVLDRKDRADLYVVDLDLKRPDLVIKDAGSVEVLGPTMLLVKNTDVGGGIHFFEVDCEARTQKEIVWK